MGFALPGAGGGGIAPEGGDVVTAIVDQILYHHTTGSDNHLITASGALPNGRNSLLDIAKSMRPAEEHAAMSVNNVHVEIRCIGGGGGGAYGGYQPFGGYPGVVGTRGFWLHELPDTSITYAIGAGAPSGGQYGGVTWLGSGSHYVRGQGGSRGGNNPLEHYKLGCIMASWDYDSSLPPMQFIPYPDYNQDFVAVDFAWHSNKGPGGGGTNAHTLGGSSGKSGRFSRYGGAGSRRSASGQTNGGSPFTSDGRLDGYDHNALYFDSMGGGGAQWSSIYNAAGRGGFPGGGGGGSDINASVSAGGGNGAIKLRFRRREIRR